MASISFHISEHDVFDGRALDEGVGKRVQRFRRAGESGESVSSFFQAQKERACVSGEGGAVAFEDAVAVEEGVLVFLEEDLTVVDHDKKICDLVEIGGDVGREEYAFAAVLHKCAEGAQQLATDLGIEAARRFVHDEQLGAMAHRQREGKFHAHAAGEGGDLLVRIETKMVEPALEILVAPAAVGRRDDALHFTETELVVETAVVQNDADAVFDGAGVCRHVEAEDAHVAAVLVDEIENGAQRRRFASAVGADKASDAAFRQGKAELLQGKAVKIFRETAHAE